MGKTRFGRRLVSSLGRGLRSSINKNKTSPFDEENDKMAEIKSCCSIESSTSSLDSTIRDHGPIDTDTNRELRPKAEVGVQSSLPRISESNANGSQADTPSTTHSTLNHSVAPPPATAAPTPTPTPAKLQEESTSTEDVSVAKSSVTSGRTSPFLSSFASGGLGLGPSPSVLERIHNWWGPSADEQGDSKLAKETPPSTLTQDGKADSRASLTDFDVSFVGKDDKYRVDIDCPDQGNGGSKYRRDIDCPEKNNGKDKYKVDIDCHEQGNSCVIDGDAEGDTRPAPEDDKYTLSPTVQMLNEALQSIERATIPIVHFNAFSVMDDGDTTYFQSNPKSPDGSKSKADAKEFKALKKVAEKGEFNKVIVERASPVGRTKPPTGWPRSPLAESRNDETTWSSSPVHKQPRRDQAEVKIASPPPDPPGLSLDDSCVKNVSSAGGAKITAETPLTGSNDPGLQRLSTASPITVESTNDVIMQPEIIHDSFDDENMFNSIESLSDSSSWHSGDESITYSICVETQRLIDQSRDFEAKKGNNLRTKSILKTSIISQGGGSQIHVATIPSDCSIRTEVIGDVAGLPSGKTEKSERKSLTWYDDKVNENKPFLLRTDESFETVWSESTQRTMGTQATRNTDAVSHMTLLDHVSEFIGKIEIGQCGADDHKYDIHEQAEI